MVRDKADFLAVRLIGCLKIQLPGHGAVLPKAYRSTSPGRAGDGLATLSIV